MQLELVANAFICDVTYIDTQNTNYLRGYHIHIHTYKYIWIYVYVCKRYVYITDCIKYFASGLCKQRRISKLNNNKIHFDLMHLILLVYIMHAYKLPNKSVIDTKTIATS